MPLKLTDRREKKNMKNFDLSFFQLFIFTPTHMLRSTNFVVSSILYYTKNATEHYPLNFSTSAKQLIPKLSPSVTQPCV